jgi:putative glycosyltransferase (TIGR04372 family)
LKIHQIFFIKILKYILRFFLVRVLKIFALLSVIIYRFIYIKKKTNYTTPTVQTYGDTLRHYQLIYLLNINYKKKFHIVSLNKEPCKTFLPFFFNKNYYSYYNEFFYLFFRKFLSLFKGMRGIIKEFDDQILTYLIKYNSSLKYYKSNYSIAKDVVYKRLKKKHSPEFIKKYLYQKNFDNKSQSLHKIRLLSKKMNFNFKKLISQSEYQAIKNNLKINSKYVCLHLRYLDDNDLRKDIRSINDLDSYTDLIKFIITEGYKVIVMGSKNDKFKLGLDSKEIIYYKDSIFQNYKNDLLLIANCDLYIGNNSGPMTAAEIFKKKSVIFDYFPMYLGSILKERIYGLKKIMNLNNNQFLTHLEISKDGIFFDANFEDLKKKNYLPIEQTSLEKLNIIKVFLNQDKNNEFSTGSNGSKLRYKLDVDEFFYKQASFKFYT